MSLEFLDVANNDAHVKNWEDAEFKNYIIALRFSATDAKIKKTEIVNMQPYGWKEIVANNLQDAAGKLMKEVAKYGKAHRVILHSHGGAAYVLDHNYLRVLDENGDEVRVAFLATDNSTNKDLRGQYYEWRKRLEEDIPIEEEEKKIYYEDREKERLEREKQRAENTAIREGTANLSKDEIDKLKKEKKWKNKDNNTNGYYDDLRQKDEDANQRKEDNNKYNEFKEDIKKEKEKLNNKLTTQIRADMTAMKTIVECIEKNKYLILAVCNVVYENSLLESIMKDTDYRVNIAGIKWLANYNKDDSGELDGHILIGKINLKDENFRFLLAKEPNNTVLLFKTNKSITSYKNIEVLQNEIKFE